MSPPRDPYEVLGVPRTATTRQIRSAYVARARLAHPDLVGHRGTDVMRGLNEAWEILKDAGRRQAWDAGNGGRAQGPASAGGTGSGAGGANGANGAAGRPFWTGAMGPPPGRPWGPVLDFGIFDGWSLGEIARRDRGYLVWLLDRPEARSFRPEVQRLLDPAADEPPEPKRDRRRWHPGR